MTKFATVQTVQTFTLPKFVDAQNCLVIAEAMSEIPHTIARAFFVKSGGNQVRGNHAHRTCKQTFICVSGLIEVVVDDGVEKRNITLDQPDKALTIPATIWATQLYKSEQSILLVLCDQPFRESDYIRTRATFLEWRNKKR